MPQPVVSKLGVSPSTGYVLNVVCAHLGVAIFVAEIMAARALTPLAVWRMLLRVRHWLRWIFSVLHSSVCATL
jgi:hypothetical protein